jgi:hypothetical protein
MTQLKTTFWILIALLIIYFAFPVILIYPVYALNGRDVPDWMVSAFMSMISLASSFKWYETWLSMQFYYFDIR